MKTHELRIEWRHLVQSGQTCQRCGDTGQALRQLPGLLARCCPKDPVNLQLIETPLPAEALAESNQVLFNGQPLELLLPDLTISQTACPSCADLTGAPAACRAVEANGERHESLPSSLLWQAATQALGCDCRRPNSFSPLYFKTNL